MAISQCQVRTDRQSVSMYLKTGITFATILNFKNRHLCPPFTKHPYFKFVIHNMIMRKRALEQSSFIIKQKLGDQQFTITELKKLIENGDTSVCQNILYFGGNLRGTTQYWEQRGKELRALVQYKINEGTGLPSFFTTGSCAEFHFKPLKRLLSMYV